MAQRSELAFVIFTVLMLLSSCALSYGIWAASSTIAADVVRMPLIAALLLLILALAFGILCMFPILRNQIAEGTKLRAITDDLSQKTQDFRDAALTDGLTGTHNRRYFDDAMKQYLEEFGRIGRPIGLMILDLDHFKRINDTYGHDIGDRVLRIVARILRDHARYHDVVARLGGEEFAIIAPNVNENDLFCVAERIREAIARTEIPTRDDIINVTTSIGVAIWNGSEPSDDLYRRADRLLYQAKREGRDRVVV